MDTDTKAFSEGYIFAVLENCNLVKQLDYKIFLKNNGCLDRIELRPFENINEELNFENLVALKNRIIYSVYNELYEFGFYIDIKNKMFVIK